MNTQTFTLNPKTFDIQLCAWQEALKHYLQTDYRKITHRQLNDKSIRLAVQHIRVFGLWHEAQFKETFEPGNLTNYDLHLYRKLSLDQEKVKAATWNSRHWALGILCLWIGHSELMDGIEKKEQIEGSEAHRALTNDEYHRLVHLLEQDPRRAVTQFEHFAATRNWSALMLMLHGLRVDECANVEIADVEIGERSGIVLVRNGKGSKQRKVTLNLQVRNAIKAYIELDPKKKTLIGLSTRSLERITKEIGTRIGVPDMTPHWLRFTFAKRLEQNGIPLEAIRRLLGHKNIETTRIYLRSSMEELQSAVEGVM